MITVFATILSIIGSLNWFLVGALEFDIVSWIFGSPTAVGSRIVYIVIGLAALWLIGYLIRVKAKMGTKV